jgi:hypothetical protein
MAQILLNCSHLFHSACILSYEAFCDAKRCPVCRAERYQKLGTSSAKEYYDRAATRIQAAWRMMRERKKYLAFREANPPKDPLLLTKFHVNKLHSITCALQESFAVENEEIDQLLKDLDKKLHSNRRIFTE